MKPNFRAPDSWLPVGVLVVVFTIGAVSIERFMSVGNLRAIVTLAAFVGVASIGLTFVVFLGGIDISIPFFVGAGNIAAAELFGAGLPFWLVVPIVVVGGAFLGALNGACSNRLTIHPLIVSLAIGTIVLGVALWLTDGFPSGAAPKGLTQFVSIGQTVGPIPLPPVVLLWVALTGLAVLVERRSMIGFEIYSLGSSPAAAELAGVRPTRTWAIAFGMSGASAALAGLLLLGFTGSASGSVGDPYLFRTIAAVVVGGTALIGGSGSYARTVLGALILSTVNSVLLGLKVEATLVQVAVGVLIIVMVGVSGRQPAIRSTI